MAKDVGNAHIYPIRVYIYIYTHTQTRVQGGFRPVNISIVTRSDEFTG